MKTLYDFPYFLGHIRAFEAIFSYNKIKLLGILMFKVDSKTEQDKKNV